LRRYSVVERAQDAVKEEQANQMRDKIMSATFDFDGRGLSLAYNRPRVYLRLISACFKASLLPLQRPR
jgi:hypothetical protein